MLKVGNIEFSSLPIIMAPMEDISDPPFRVICKNLGADLVYTEFLSSEGLIRNAGQTKAKLDFFAEERPVAIQVFGHDPNSLREAVAMIEAVNPDFIDINFGCPVRRVVNKGAGAAALKFPEKMVKLTSEVINATNIPVTVKTRIGWDHQSIVIEELSEKLQDVGVKALALHARTARQMYTGKADWEWFKKVKANPRFKIPLYGNGDVKTPEDALKMRDEYEVDGIMIGRAVVGNPWIFRETKHFFATGEHLPIADTNERVDVCKMHLLESIKWKGEKRGIFEMRKHYRRYFRDYINFREFREKLVESKDVNELLEILETVRTGYKEGI